MSSKEYVNAATAADFSGSVELFIKTTIDKLVAKTGLPAVSKILIDEGIATRKEIRKMERKGIIKRLPMSGGQGIHNCYYTEDALPKSVREWREKQDENIQRVGAGADKGDDESDGYDEAKKLYEEKYGEPYDQPNA